MNLILKGLGIGGGFAKGKVKIVENLEKLPEIEEGLILVTPFFTPLVTMLVPKSKALITDFGGITCHAAVIAREFNTPCIVGLNEATSKLKDGQEIAIDAEKGEVYEL